MVNVVKKKVAVVYVIARNSKVNGRYIIQKTKNYKI